MVGTWYKRINTYLKAKHDDKGAPFYKLKEAVEEGTPFVVGTILNERGRYYVTKDGNPPQYTAVVDLCNKCKSWSKAVDATDAPWVMRSDHVYQRSTQVRRSEPRDKSKASGSKRKRT